MFYDCTRLWRASDARPDKRIAFAPQLGNAGKSHCVLWLEANLFDVYYTSVATRLIFVNIWLDCKQATLACSTISSFKRAIDIPTGTEYTENELRESC